MELLHALLDKFLYSKSAAYKYIVMLISFMSIFLITHEYSSQLPWNVDTVVWTYGYFLMGNLSKNVFTTQLFNNRPVLLLATALMVFMAIYLGYQGKLSSINMSLNQVSDPAVFLILSIVLVYVTANVCRLFLDFHLLSVAGQYTLFCFAWNLQILAIMSMILDKLNLYSSFYVPYNYISVPLGAIVCYATLVSIAYMLGRKCPYIIGKSFDISKVV